MSIQISEEEGHYLSEADNESTQGNDPREYEFESKMKSITQVTKVKLKTSGSEENGNKFATPVNQHLR